MNIRLLGFLVGFGISFASPTFAQEKESVDPQLRRVADALSKKFDEAYDKNDAAAVAELFTEDAVLITPQGPIYGREAIEKHYLDVFQKVHFSNHSAKPDQYAPHIIGAAGNEMWWNGEWNVTIQGQTGGPTQLKGYWASIVVREGDVWKDRMQISNTAPPPAPAQTK